LMEITKRPSFTMVEGSGSYLVDDAGKRYLDFVQGWAVNCLGHSPKVIVDALSKQAAKLINCSPAFYNEPMKELATLLTKTTGLDKVFFTNSGAEANEGAIKLARKWGAVNREGAFEIITMENSFHGRTLATMSASGKPQWKDLFEPKVPGFIKVPINDLEKLEAAITRKTVAIMLEPIQGEAGVIPAQAQFMNGIRALADKHKILMIVDEIQTGVGRTGTLFAFEQYGLKPDILTVGKGLGGGVPLAAMVATEAVSCFEHGDQGGTFNGTALITAVGIAVLTEVARAEFLQQVVSTGAKLRSRLEQISQTHKQGEVRGQGLLLSLTLSDEFATNIVSAALEEGLLLNAPNSRTLRFMPALNVSAEEVDQMADQLEKLIAREVQSRDASS
ncbi:MAG TPA: acetylornithine transaminase, partial [Chroococcales cyanobacterium]